MSGAAGAGGSHSPLNWQAFIEGTGDFEFPSTDGMTESQFFEEHPEWTQASHDPMTDVSAEELSTLQAQDAEQAEAWDQLEAVPISMTEEGKVEHAELKTDIGQWIDPEQKLAYDAYILDVTLSTAVLELAATGGIDRAVASAQLSQDPETVRKTIEGIEHLLLSPPDLSTPGQGLNVPNLAEGMVSGHLAATTMGVVSSGFFAMLQEKLVAGITAINANSPTDQAQKGQQLSAEVQQKIAICEKWKTSGKTGLADKCFESIGVVRTAVDSQVGVDSVRASAAAELTKAKELLEQGTFTGGIQGLGKAMWTTEGRTAILQALNSNFFTRIALQTFVRAAPAMGFAVAKNLIESQLRAAGFSDRNARLAANMCYIAATVTCAYLLFGGAAAVAKEALVMLVPQFAGTAIRGAVKAVTHPVATTQKVASFATSSFSSAKKYWTGRRQRKMVADSRVRLRHRNQFRRPGEAEAKDRIIVTRYRGDAMHLRGSKRVPRRKD